MILLQKKPSSSESLLTVDTPNVCSVMNSPVRIRTCSTYTTLDIYTETIHFVYICTNMYCKLIRRNLCVLQDTIAVYHTILLLLVWHNHYSLIPTHGAAVVVAYYYVLTFNSNLVCTPFMGRAQSPRFTFGTIQRWDPRGRIPSLGSHLLIHILTQR